MSWDDVVKLVLAALFGAVATLTVTWLKSLRDEQRDRADKFAEAVLEVAELAASFWVIEANDPGVRLQRVKLVASQTYLERFRLLACDGYSTQHRGWILASLADLFDAMTGGDFSGPERQIDPTRAQDCLIRAAEVSVRVREGFRDSMKFTHQVRRLFRLPV